MPKKKEGVDASSRAKCKKEEEENKKGQTV